MWFHNGAYFGKQLGVLIFRFRFAPRGYIVYARNARLKFFDSNFHNRSAPAKYILGYTMLAVQ